MEVLALLVELAAIANGVSSAINIVKAAKASGRTHLTPEESAQVSAVLANAHPSFVDFLKSSATGA